MQEQLGHSDFRHQGTILHAPLTEEVHVIPPPEVYSSEAQSGVVWRLKRALYGLRQAPKAWQQHLTHVLSSMGIIQLKSVSCMFKNQLSNMLIIFYVDDILVPGDQSEENAFINQLKKNFDLQHTSVLVEGSWILFIGRKLYGIIEISMMESFFKSLYAIYQLKRANQVNTPGVKGSTLPNQGSELLHCTDHKKYRTSMWLSAIRPDIQYSVKDQSQAECTTNQ
eukprot:4656304-Amphidinium_carterae.1